MMSNNWLRLWHDMPNDPKWRTIARSSGQPICLVIAVYTHLLVDASRNVTRGHVDVTHEDLASALDVTDDAVVSILAAMQGRVMDGDYLSGWDRRQVKREDAGNLETGAKTAAQRKREQRGREKQVDESQHNQQCHDMSRNITTDKIRGDKSKPSSSLRSEEGCADKTPRFQAQKWLEAKGVDSQVASDWIKLRKTKKLESTVTAFEGVESEAAKSGRALSDVISICARNGWAGFRASWNLDPDSSGSKQSRHAGFDNIDYRAGVAADGRF